jgi:hypothetical protein
VHKEDMQRSRRGHEQHMAPSPTISPARTMSTSRSRKADCIDSSCAFASSDMDWRIPSARVRVVYSPLCGMTYRCLLLDGGTLVPRRTRYLACGLSWHCLSDHIRTGSDSRTA